MIDIAVGKLLLHTAGLRSTDCPAGSGTAEWRQCSRRGRDYIVRARGAGVQPAGSHQGRHVADPGGHR